MKTKKLQLLHGVYMCLFLLSCEKEIFPNDIPEETFSGTFELTVDEAKNILLGFIGDEIKTKSGSTINIIDQKKHVFELNSVYTRSGESVEQSIPVYEFVVKEEDQKGFALVAADKRINSVLAYIPKGSFTQGLEDEYFQRYIKGLPYFFKNNLEELESLSMDPQIKSILTQSPKILTKNITEEADPYPIVNGFDELYPCYLYTEWGQGYPYNSQVPMECIRFENKSYPQNASAGCVPVAIGQILGYHRLGPYNWDALLEKPIVAYNDFHDRIYEVGFLMYNLGLQTNVKYSCSGSPATANKYIAIMNGYGYKYYLYNVANKNIFDYLSQKYYTSSYTYNDYVIENLKQNHPIFAATSTHAYVIDGYGMKKYPIDIIIDKEPVSLTMNSIYYRINTGWEGLSNGWYLNLNGFLYWSIYFSEVNFTSIPDVTEDEYFYLLMDESELTYTGSVNPKPGGGLGCPNPGPCENSGLLK